MSPMKITYVHIINYLGKNLANLEKMDHLQQIYIPTYLICKTFFFVQTDF